MRLNSASCWVRMHSAVFHGTGTAALNRVRGYLMRFTIVVGDNGRIRVSTTVLAAKRETVDHELDRASALDTTVFAAGVPVDLSSLL